MNEAASSEKARNAQRALGRTEMGFLNLTSVWLSVETDADRRLANDICTCFRKTPFFQGSSSYVSMQEIITL